MKYFDLMIPGPVQVDYEVLQEMAVPQIAHYGEDALRLYRECAQYLSRIFETEGNIIIMNGSGSVAFDACVGSSIRENDKVLVGINGGFGERMKQIALSYGAQVVEVRTEEGKPVTADLIKAQLKNNKDAKAILIVHHETCTGVLNPVQDMGEVAGEYGIPLIVDAVASIGIDFFAMDKWNVSLCATASQKGLEVPPGLGIVAINEKGWKALEDRISLHHGWYSNLLVWKKTRDIREGGFRHMGPLVTIAVNNIRALHCSLKKMIDEGMEERVERHARIARMVRAGIRKIGFQTLPEDKWASNGMTSVKNNLNINIKELITFLMEEYNIQIGAGLGKLSHKIFRIGHIGQSASLKFVVPVLFGIEHFLREKGFNIPVGASLIGVK